MANYFIYTTLSKDTYDSISLDFYNQEMLSLNIITANPEYRNTILFSGGEILMIPLIEQKAADTLPPWKRV